MRRPGRLLLGAALLLAVLGAGQAVLWRWMADRLESGFDAWIAARRAAGWRVEHGPRLRGGWPLDATLTLPGFRLTGGGATLPGGLDWQAERVVLRLRPPRLDRLAIEVPGRQRLALGGVELPYAADRLGAALPLARDVLPAEATLLAERLRIGIAGGLEINRFRLDLETRATAIEGEPALLLRLDAEVATFSRTVPPLGRTLEALRAELSISGPVPGSAGGAGPAARAAIWRDGGGTVALRDLAVRWGSVAATAEATLTLDEALQPMGVGRLRLTGGAEALTAAQEAEAMTGMQAVGLRLLLRTLEREPAEGGAPLADLPLTLQDRRLGVAKLPLATLPPLVWPAPAPAPE